MSTVQVNGHSQYNRADILARYVLACFGSMLGVNDSWVRSFEKYHLPGLLVDRGIRRDEDFLSLCFSERLKQRQASGGSTQRPDGEELFEILYFRCFMAASGRKYQPDLSAVLAKQNDDALSEIVFDLDWWLSNLGKRLTFPEGRLMLIRTAAKFLTEEVGAEAVAGEVFPMEGEDLRPWERLKAFWPNLEFHVIGLLYFALQYSDELRLVEIHGYKLVIAEQVGIVKDMHYLVQALRKKTAAISDAFAGAVDWEASRLD